MILTADRAFFTCSSQGKLYKNTINSVILHLIIPQYNDANERRKAHNVTEDFSMFYFCFHSMAAATASLNAPSFSLI